MAPPRHGSRVGEGRYSPGMRRIVPGLEGARGPHLRCPGDFSAFRSIVCRSYVSRRCRIARRLGDACGTAGGALRASSPGHEHGIPDGDLRPLIG